MSANSNAFYNGYLTGLAVALFMLLMLALGSCTETILEEVIKLDTVYISKPQALSPTFITVRDTVHVIDTVEVKVIVHDTIIQQIHTTDTLIQYVTRDSLIIREVEKVVHHTDTVVKTVIKTVVNNVVVHDTVTETIIQHDTVTLMAYDRTVIYLDTMWVIGGIRPVYSVPDGFQTHINEFYTLAGSQAIGGVILISYVHPDDLPGEDWVSESFWIGGRGSQMYIGVSESLPPELHRASILRELARLQLKKKYVTDESKLMCPWWNTNNTITQQNLNELFANPQPI